MSLLAAATACAVSLGSTLVPSPRDLQPPPPPAPDPAGNDYRHRLQATAFGWPRRYHWCVWVEPANAEGPAARWDQAWLQAVDGALATWGGVLPITRVSNPDQAQVLVFRRRPPLKNGRASHGRAVLELAKVKRASVDGSVAQTEQLEPRVTVMISPGQRPEAIEATALHELGHAFGLWGHSDNPADAMAAVPGAKPVRQLSPRDRATVLWLQQQPGLR
ncbi:peptidase [Synechococcus sp. FGCU-3]|nr:peptidase [Synechococcus sp. FGCU3]